MTLLWIPVANLVISALVFLVPAHAAAAQTGPYEDSRRVNPAVSRSAMLAARPSWNLALDDAGIDARLNAFAAMNSGNPAVQPTLVRAALAMNRDVARYVSDDGSANTAEIAALLAEQFGQAGRIVMPKVAIDYTSGNAALDSAGNLSDMDEGDIVALAFIVMMQAAKSAREDLKGAMEETKAINAQKKALREAANRVDELAANCVVKPENCRPGDIDPNVLAAAQPGHINKQDINAAKENIKVKLDSLGEVGESQSLRLQMAMDRQTKFMSALSNLLKKTSETSSGIIQNIK